MFYEHLFRLDPALRGLFKGDMQAQGKKLMQMIGAAVGMLDDVPKLMPVLANGPIDVTIVGDVTLQQAIDVTARTFGAFVPRTGARIATSAANTTRFPAGAKETTRLVTTDQKGQEIAVVVWPTQGRFPDLKASITLQILGTVVNDRLFDRLRGMGTVYSAQVGATSSKVFDYGYVQALAQLMMSSVCADLLAANVPENVRLLRSYLAVEQGRVHLNDWLGQKILNPKA